MKIIKRYSTKKIKMMITHLMMEKMIKKKRLKDKENFKRILKSEKLYIINFSVGSLI
jgi:hypothetical protein